MPLATVPNAGTFDLEVDTGFTVNAFTLDDTVKGVLDNTTYILNGTTSYASITDGVLSATILRGRKDPADQFPAGTMTFVLDDTLADGVFNPFDTGSPYFDDAQAYPGLAPNRQVRFTRYDASNNPQRLFVGWVVNYNYNFQLDGTNTVTVFCADSLYKLSNTFMTEHNPTKELTGARINAILDRAEVNYPGGAARSIATGTVELGGGATYEIREGTNVKSYFESITQTAERGRIYVDRDGVLVSENRIGNTLATQSVVFTDNTANTSQARYDALGITFKAEDLINRVAVTPLGGTQQVADNTASQTKYFVKSLYIDGSLLHDNTAAATLASYLLYPEPVPRFNDISTFYGRLTAALRDACAILDIGDTIQIDKKIPVNGVLTTRSEDVAIEGLEHRITFAGGMTSRYYTSPTAIVYALILDDAVFGRLDADNAVT